MSRNIAPIATILLLLGPLSQARAGDREDIAAVIEKYVSTQDAGDLSAQAKLMTPDRVWLSTGAGRRVDQAKNMAIQQKQLDASRQADSPVTFISETRDLDIRFHAKGTVAVASFYWHFNPVLTGPAPDGFTPPTPRLVTHVLVKDSGSWKIAHTHVSPMYVRPGGS